jgi:hypothetical protein
MGQQFPLQVVHMMMAATWAAEHVVFDNRKREIILKCDGEKSER